MHMPVQIEMGLSIMAAVSRQCSEEVARIACMIATGGSRVFRQTQGQSQSQASKAFAAQSGDHETYLNVFEAWLANQKSREWCSQQGLHSAVLEAADEILRKVHRVMGQNQLPAVHFSGNDSSQRSTAIMQSLCAGYFRQLASAADPTDSAAGFWLVEDYDTNPKAAGLVRGSVLQNTSPVHTVLFGQQLATGNGNKVLACVSQVDPQWVVQAASGDGLALQNAQAVKAMERKEYHVPVMPFPTVSSLLDSPRAGEGGLGQGKWEGGRQPRCLWDEAVKQIRICTSYVAVCCVYLQFYWQKVLGAATTLML